MNDGYIALIDSGVGGISLLIELLKELPNEKYLYYGDNHNAPYGSKNISLLREITFRNIDYIKRYKVKLLVVACNTLSVNLLKEIEDYSGIKTFGVFPPVEKAILQGGKKLLLATERTAENYKGIKGLATVGLKTLAGDIEDNMFNLDCLSLQEKFNQISQNFVNEKFYYDTVILGCTHYFFVKNQIFDHLRPRKIIFGESFTAKKIKNYLKNSKSSVKIKQNQIIFIGENAKLNQKFYNFYTQKNNI